MKTTLEALTELLIAAAAANDIPLVEALAHAISNEMARAA